MKVIININQELTDEQPTIVMSLYTKNESDYIEGSKEGIYHYTTTLPKNDHQMMKVIEGGINIMIHQFEKDMSDKFNAMIESHNQDAEKMMDMLKSKATVN